MALKMPSEKIEPNKAEKTNETVFFILYGYNLKSENFVPLQDIYIDQNKIGGVDVDDKDIKHKIYDQYLEAFKIGDSLPAPLFQIVSKPNEWSRTVKSAASSQNLSGAKIVNLEYWTAMKKYFDEKGTSLKHQKPQPQHWTNFALGKSYFHMAAVSSVRDNFFLIQQIKVYHGYCIP